MEYLLDSLRMRGNEETLIFMDILDIYTLGKAYTEMYNWTYTDDELYALAEFFCSGDEPCGFNVKLIFEDNNCIIVDDIVEDYEIDENARRFICSNGKVICEY